jgi:4-carboxymuconolactone decarboxylase
MSKSRGSVAVQGQGLNGLFRAKQSVDIPWGQRQPVKTPLKFALKGPLHSRGTRMTEQKPAAGLIGDIAPKLAQITDDVLFGDVWQRPGLSQRDRSLATVSALIALNRMEQLPFHIRRALENGIRKDELIEVITHLAFYSGWPNSMSAVRIARDEFAKQG